MLRWLSQEYGIDSDIERGTKAFRTPWAEIGGISYSANDLMTASILNFAGPDLVIILAIVVLLFGARRIPKLARGIRLSILEFRKASKPSSESSERPETRESKDFL
jgi:sec-independent protein translocase protein TatA